jgi:hypothetical protein
MKKGRPTGGWRQLGSLLSAAICLTISAKLGLAADQTVGLSASDKPPPKEIAESIRPTLDAKAYTLLVDQKPALDIWLRQEVPLKSPDEKEPLASIGETTLVGAVSVQGSVTDYKGNDVPKGTYTARFELQPQDGDHLGTAEFPYFVVLTPAEADKELKGLNTFKSLTKASGKATSSGHPVVLSLRPAAADAKTPQLDEPAADHKAIRLKLNGKAEGGEKPIVFDLVYQGKGH